MINDTTRGRHRAPGRHNPLSELKLLARESAQPALKAGALVAATGGLVAGFANPASADTLSPAAAPANAAAAPQGAPAAVGPATAAAPASSTALSKIGFAPAVQHAAAKRVAQPTPQVIQDLQVQAQRAASAKAAAAKAAAAQAAAARKAAAERASRDLTRHTLTASTSTTKPSSNGYAPGASAGMRASHNWATAGQCTWGALNKWYQSEGYYPGGWTGNAMAWASGARSAGYTVSSTPRTRSIIVMQPGVAGSSSVGHVGWVTAVNGNRVTIIEMNATAGPYNYDTRTVTLSGGMDFIYAP
ncbi:CHAP domain-containing protein [Terrabacter sp. BE26]|uniref:CHAP domain-containing protein n=1 Tax=Terrabacter sp. BE26 TaxID=2898152 RepID=UPI0035BE60CB